MLADAPSYEQAYQPIAYCSPVPFSITAGEAIFCLTHLLFHSLFFLTVITHIYCFIAFQLTEPHSDTVSFTPPYAKAVCDADRKTN